MNDAGFFVCSACGQSHVLDSRDWRCECGGLLELGIWPAFDTSLLDTSAPGLWRYRSLLPLDPAWDIVTLGEGNTPLVKVDWRGQPLVLKLESLAPTGSFKDRGAAVLVTAMRGLGIKRAVEDSSGNAGASLAAYAAQAGISCEICVPEPTPPPKLAQMASYGAEVIQIKGKREYAALAAWAAAAHGAYYASHVYNPFFLAGMETMAYELWEQLAGRVPAALILPVGNGTLLLGAYRGFRRLLQAGLIGRLPRIFAVQAAACAPIYQAFVEGRDSVQPTASMPTAATAIVVNQPARGAQILAAVRDTGGAVLTVSEEEILQTHGDLACRGFYVEQTSAVAVAGLPQLSDVLPRSGDEPVVIPVTAHGLKTSPTRSR